MVEDAQFRARKPGGIHDTGVNELVEDDDVIFAGECCDSSDGSGVAGGKNQCCLGFLEGGERFFQFVKWRKRTANQTRCTRARAEFFHGLDGRRFQRGMIGEAEIVVRGKIEEGFAADFNVCALRGIHAAQFAKQVLFAERSEALVEFVGERSHNWEFTICDLRFTSKKTRRAANANGKSRGRNRPAPFNHAGGDVAGVCQHGFVNAGRLV